MSSVANLKTKMKKVKWMNMAMKTNSATLPKESSRVKTIWMRWVQVNTAMK